MRWARKARSFSLSDFLLCSLLTHPANWKPVHRTCAHVLLEKSCSIRVMMCWSRKLRSICGFYRVFISGTHVMKNRMMLFFLDGSTDVNTHTHMYFWSVTTRFLFRWRQKFFVGEKRTINWKKLGANDTWFVCRKEYCWQILTLNRLCSLAPAKICAEIFLICLERLISPLVPSSNKFNSDSSYGGPRQ